MKAYYFASFTFFATYERQLNLGSRLKLIVNGLVTPPPPYEWIYYFRWWFVRNHLQGRGYFGDVFGESQQLRQNVNFLEVNLANGNFVLKVVVDCQVGVAVAVAVCVGGVGSLKCVIVLAGVVSVAVRLLRSTWVWLRFMARYGADSSLEGSWHSLQVVSCRKRVLAKTVDVSFPWKSWDMLGIPTWTKCFHFIF